MPAQTPDEQIAAIRALLDLQPDADVVLAVRNLHNHCHFLSLRLASLRSMIEPAFRMLKKSIEM